LDKASPEASPVQVLQDILDNFEFLIFNFEWKNGIAGMKVMKNNPPEAESR
jgi:hypothetical protein